MKTIAAVTSTVFTYCIFLNTPEADAFSRVATPAVGVSSAAVSKSSLAAASGQHSTNCDCSMCSVGRDLSNVRLNSRGAHGLGCPCDACSQAVLAAHGNGCPCNGCSQAARSAHGDGCPCNACSQATHGVSCNCPSCVL